MVLIKTEILTSPEVLYAKSCTRNQFLFCKKMLSKNMDFSGLKCQLKLKNWHSMCVKTFGAYLSNYCTFRTKCYYILD